MVKKKKTEKSNQSSEQQATADSSDHVVQPACKLPFKNKKFITSRAGHSKKSRGWKTLKQMIASEKPQPGVVLYATLDAPPSKKPAKKYSDLSGLPAKYKDPTTKLLYYNSDEFTQIRMLSPDIIKGYLDLRETNE